MQEQIDIPLDKKSELPWWFRYAALKGQQSVSESTDRPEEKAPVMLRID